MTRTCSSKDTVDGPVVAVKNETATSRPNENNITFILQNCFESIFFLL